MGEGLDKIGKGWLESRLREDGINKVKKEQMLSKSRVEMVNEGTGE